MDSRNFAIGILSTTAVILLVGIMIIHSTPEPAFASGMTARGGNYTMTVGSVSTNDEELLFMLNGPAQKMIVYRFDIGRRQVEIIQGVDLAEMREGAAAGSKSGSKKSRRKKRGP